MKKLFIITLAALSLLVSCRREEMPEEQPTVITVSLQQTKTVLGAQVGTKRPVYWSDGDCLTLNGAASEPLTDLAPQTATARFHFNGSFTAPYNLLYPASLYKDATHVTLPSAQTWAADGVVAVPLSGVASSISGEGTTALSHLCAILQLRIKRSASVDAANLIAVRFRGNAGEQVCGDFAIDYASASLTPAGEGAEITMSLNQPLSVSESLDLFLVVPAGTYSSGFTVVLEDASHRTMTLKKASAFTFEKGQLARSAETAFVPSALAGSLTLEDVDVESMGLDGYNVTGRVVDAVSGAGLSDVVVSDGLQCVRTLSDGRFYMKSNLSKTKFVWVSTPSGFTAPAPSGIPQFYKFKSGITPSGGIYDFGNYVLEPVENPNHFKLFISADPQQRHHDKWNIDNVAYRSPRAAEDLNRELKETAATVTDCRVYGICLGDLVHEDMSLLGTSCSYTDATPYAAGLATLGFPTYNVIGNHDHDPSAADDEAGVVPFENLFGPRNYSFNIGGIHFVVLDNMIMAHNGSKLTVDPNHEKGGLTEEIWTWLQADLALVPTSTKLMVCSHAPMFHADSNAERTGGSHPVQYGPEYGDLINDYAEVHVWAGHTHVGFNYNYASDHRHTRVQVHTLARSTGELWTNEYVADGTPRGFTIVDVNEGVITWKFHPTRYQKAAFQGQGGAYNAPSYTYRDWSYNASNVAVMNGGGSLTEDYQMHVYAPGTYEAGYVYANVFLWDDKWGTPTFSLNGGAAADMTHLAYTDEGSYDYATHELRAYYLDKSSLMKSVSDSYEDKTKGLWTIFKVPCSAAHGTGTVSVTDRFGNNYSRSITW